MRSRVGRSSRMYQDYKDLLSAFHAHGVKYLIVGGYAVIFHAQPRATNDIDLFIKPDPANARAGYDALAEFGARSRTSARRISPAAAAFFASDANRVALIYSQVFQVSI